MRGRDVQLELLRKPPIQRTKRMRDTSSHSESRAPFHAAPACAFGGFPGCLVGFGIGSETAVLSDHYMLMLLIWLSHS